MNKMKEVKRDLRVEVIPSVPKELGIWAEDKDKDRMSSMFPIQKFNPDGTKSEEKNIIKVSTQRNIETVLNSLTQTDDYYYSYVSVMFDVLRGMPVILFNKYALVRHGTKRTMLVQYQVMATLSHKLAAMANFMDAEYGFRTTEFKEWVLANQPNILPFLKAGEKDKVLIECNGPRCALLFETPEDALNAFSKFDNIHIFDIHKKGISIWVRQELYNMFKSDKDNETQEWASHNTFYNLFSNEVMDKFKACKYGQYITVE